MRSRKWATCVRLDAALAQAVGELPTMRSAASRGDRLGWSRPGRSFSGSWKTARGSRSPRGVPRSSSGDLVDLGAVCR